MVYGKSLEVGESPIRQNMTGTNQPPEKTPRTCEQSCSHVDNLYFRCSFQHTEQTSIFNKMNKFNLFESLCSTFFNQRNPLQGQSIDGIRSIRSITFFFGSVSFNPYLQHFSTKVQWFNPISHPKNLRAAPGLGFCFSWQPLALQRCEFSRTTHRLTCFFFGGGNSSSLYVFFEQNMGTYYLNHLKSSS